MEMPRGPPIVWYDACTNHVVTTLSYLLPFRSASAPTGEFIDYVNGLATHAEVLLIDGSPEPVYAAVESRRGATIRHLAPDADLATVANGKVRGVLTGLRRASHDAVVIADDDVRHTPDTLQVLVDALDKADVVRPQNYFSPLPWHARIDTARILINRMTGGDWPGTLAVRRSRLVQTGGYDGDVLFENLELVRTGWCWWYSKYAPDNVILAELQRRARQTENKNYAATEF